MTPVAVAGARVTVSPSMPEPMCWYFTVIAGAITDYDRLNVGCGSRCVTRAGSIGRHGAGRLERLSNSELGAVGQHEAFRDFGALHAVLVLRDGDGGQDRR